MEQWLSPRGDESMKTEGMESCLPDSQAQSGAASDPVTGGDIPAERQEYLASINTNGKQQAVAAPHSHLGEQVSLFKQIIKS